MYCFRILHEGQEDDEDDLKYFVKWTDLGYNDCTWETKETLMKTTNGPAEIKEYEQREKRAKENLALALSNRKKEPKKEKSTLSLHVSLLVVISALEEMDSAQKLASFKQVYPSQPKFVKGGSLYSYQVDGLNFLHSAWLNDINVILAGPPPPS
jgi:hypothetical protein